jgi:hypothetical protein
MFIERKVHVGYFDVSIVAIKCHIMSFVAELLCDLPKMTKHCNKSYVTFMTKNGHL